MRRFNLFNSLKSVSHKQTKYGAEVRRFHQNRANESQSRTQILEDSSFKRSILSKKWLLMAAGSVLASTLAWWSSSRVDAKAEEKKEEITQNRPQGEIEEKREEKPTVFLQFKYVSFLTFVIFLRRFF